MINSMFKKSLVGVVLTTSMMVGGVGATPFILDVDGVGGQPGIAVASFGVKSYGGTAINVDLGDDGKLSSGDSFTESVLYFVNKIEFADGTFLDPVVPGFMNTLAFVGNFEGTVEDVVLGTDAITGDVLDVDISSNVSDNFDASKWSLNFTGTDVSMYTSTADIPGALAGNLPAIDSTNLLATFNAVTGGTTPGDPISGLDPFDLGLNFEFSSMADDVWFSLAGDNLKPILDGLAPGSLNPFSVAVTDTLQKVDATSVSAGTSLTGNDTLHLMSYDNGGSGEVLIPEPTSLALLGIGLLGFGAAKRRKN